MGCCDGGGFVVF